MDPLEANGAPPIFSAINEGDASELEKLMLEMEADEESQIFFAIEESNAGEVEELLRQGVDLEVTAAQFHEGMTPLLLALYQTDAEIAAFLLRAGADPHNRGDYSSPPIHLAAIRSLLCLALLLDAGADVNALDDHGDTPLMHVATHDRYAEKLSLLLAAGADPLHRNREGSTAHDLADKHGAKEILRRLEAPRTEDTPAGSLASILEPHMARLEDRMARSSEIRQLFQAIEAHDQEAVLAALAAGVSVDVVDTHEDGGFTPLQLAATVGNLSAVTMLLQQGADATTVNQHGKTAFSLATFHGHDAITEILSPFVDEEERAQIFDLTARDRRQREREESEEYKRRDDLFMAIARQDIAEVKRLLPAIDVNDTEDSRRPLLVALEWGLEELVPILLDAGADPNICLANRPLPSTPLGMAATTQASRRRLTELLLHHGADVNVRGFNGATPLHEAALFAARGEGSLDGLEALLRAGASVAARDDFGNTPWMLAAFQVAQDDWRSPPSHRAAVAAVLEKSVSDHASVELLLAAQQADEKRAVAALAAGADPQARTPTGASALFLAVQTKTAGLVRTLLKAGADPSIPDPLHAGGTTPLQLAEKEGLREIEALLRSPS